MGIIIMPIGNITKQVKWHVGLVNLATTLPDQGSGKRVNDVTLILVSMWLREI